MKRMGMLAAAAIAATATYAWAEDSITIVSWGGAYQESQRKAYFEPYAKEAGVKIVEEEFGGEIAKIRAQVESGNVTWDIVDNDSQTVLAACAEGIIEKIDWAKLGLDRSKFLSADSSDCVVPTILYATVFAYDTSKLNPGPTTIADFFDTKKFPGKRGLQKNPFANLEWALIADGVTKEDVYKVLATPEGVDRAFAKLDTIKSDVIWWDAGAVPPQMLADGQVVMTSAWNGRIFKAIKDDKKPFAIVWDHQVLDWEGWTITKGSPKIEQAYKFIAYASSVERQADQTNYISYGPSNQDAISKINPETAKVLPTTPENMKTAFVGDAQFWADKGEELRERFNAWVAQ